MRGQYGGIDTANICETGDFSFLSFLTDRTEAISIGFRPDIDNLIDLLLRMKKITQPKRGAIQPAPKPGAGALPKVCTSAALARSKLWVSARSTFRTPVDAFKRVPQRMIRQMFAACFKPIEDLTIRFVNN